MIAALVLLACAGELSGYADTADTAGCVNGPIVTWESGGESFFRSYCVSCHSSQAIDRHGAPEYLNYDTLDGVREARHSIREAALWDQVMPPGYPLEEEQRAILSSFLHCGL